MFDTGLRVVDDAGVVAEIGSATRAEASAAARRLAAIAELVRRRCGGDDRALWACDSWDAAAAEVSAAMGVSAGRASAEMYLGSVLFSRLPQVAALFQQGVVGYRVVAAIADRTDLVTDTEVLAAIDTALAGLAGGWGPLSRYKLDQVIDVVVDRHDPGALRRNRAAARSRGVEIGGRNDEAGISSVWGRLYSSDAQLLDRRLAAMAAGVCEHDPRTVSQRRADALGALAAGAETLACKCDAPQCAAAVARATAAGVVIHILAETTTTPAQPGTDPDPVAGSAPAPGSAAASGSGTVVGPAAASESAAVSGSGTVAGPAAASGSAAVAGSGAASGSGVGAVPVVGPAAGAAAGPPGDPYLSGHDPTYEPFTLGTDLNAYLKRTPAPEPDPVCPPGHGVILGGATVPGPLLAELIRAGATLRRVPRPADAPEPGYRPSTGLAEFVRMRDMSCRFPNCDVPAQFCDIDHAIAWPHGPTHPSNLRCLCRKHHLLKTFWTGPRGWTDTQSPDATIRWTSPTGAVYTTVAGSRLFFPTWNTTTATLTIPTPPTPDEPSPGTGLARSHQQPVPQRQRTRIANRASRIKRERALNNQRVTERNAPPPF